MGTFWKCTGVSIVQGTNCVMSHRKDKATHGPRVWLKGSVNYWITHLIRAYWSKRRVVTNRFFSESITTQKRNFTWCHRKQSLLVYKLTWCEVGGDGTKHTEKLFHLIMTCCHFWEHVKCELLQILNGSLHCSSQFYRTLQKVGGKSQTNIWGETNVIR